MWWRKRTEPAHGSAFNSHESAYFKISCTPARLPVAFGCASLPRCSRAAELSRRDLVESGVAGKRGLVCGQAQASSRLLEDDQHCGCARGTQRSHSGSMGSDDRAIQDSLDSQKLYEFA